MGRAANHTKPKKNPTEERLRATPFETVAELDDEQNAIRLSVLRKFSAAQVINELLTKKENDFIVDEWRAGLVAFYGTGPKERIYKIFSEGRGLKLELNKEYTKTLGDQEIKFVECALRAGIEGYGSLYMNSKSLMIDTHSPDINDSKITETKKSKHTK